MLGFIILKKTCKVDTLCCNFWYIHLLFLPMPYNTAYLVVVLTWLHPTQPVQQLVGVPLGKARQCLSRSDYQWISSMPDKLYSVIFFLLSQICPPGLHVYYCWYWAQDFPYYKWKNRSWSLATREVWLLLWNNHLDTTKELVCLYR